MPFTQLRSGSVMVVVFTTLMRQPYRESGLVLTLKADVNNYFLILFIKAGRKTLIIVTQLH
jgi:hypothetical protein